MNAWLCNVCVCMSLYVLEQISSWFILRSVFCKRGFLLQRGSPFLYKSSDVPFVRMYRSIILTTIRPAHEQMWFMLSDPGSTAVWSTSSLDGGHWSVTDLVPVLVGKCREFPVEK